jgi:cell division protein FtsW
VKDLVASVTVDAYVPAAGSARREAGMLLAVTVFLLLAGLITVYSATSFLAQKQGLPDHFYLRQQASRALVGLMALYVLARVDYRIYRQPMVAWPLLGLTVIALLVLVLPGTEAIAPPRNGARRWIELLGMRVQPSEVAKLVMVIWAAAIATKKGERIRSLRWGLGAFSVVYLVVALLIMLEPDLSSAILIGMLCAIILFAAGARVSHFVLIAVVALPLLWEWVKSSSYVIDRIRGWVGGGADPSGVGHQLEQSLIAVGSGGLFGLGYGESTQKYFFLPEAHNDFAFAIIAEEWGLVGAGAIVLALATVGVLGLRIARRAPDAFGFLVAVGLSALIVVSALIHMCVTLGMLPTTGMTLPFISYGGSSLVVSLAAVGVLLNIGSWRA